MALRHYLCQIVQGSGMLMPVFEEILPGVGYSADDGRRDSTLTSGWMLVSADVTDAQHATLDADARVRSVPFVDLLGNPLGLEDLLELIPLTTRQTLRDRLEAEHIPVHDLTLAHTVRDVLKRMARRLKLRNAWLKLDDYVEGLDTLVSDIPSQRRQTIRDRLVAAGYDPSAIALSDTIRAALAKLLLQGVRANATRFG